MVDLSGVLGLLPNRDAVVAALERVPVTRDAVSPFVPGATVSDAVAAAEEVLLAGMSVAVVHLPDPADREIAGFIAAGLAFGRVASILASIDAVLGVMGPSPAAFVRARTQTNGNWPARARGGGHGGERRGCVPA